MQLLNSVNANLCFNPYFTLYMTAVGSPNPALLRLQKRRSLLRKLRPYIDVSDQLSLATDSYKNRLRRLWSKDQV